jgi:hypothetical protein
LVINNVGTYLTVCLFRVPLEYLITKPPVPTKRTTVSLIKVRTCNALLRKLLVCIRSSIKSVLRYKFLILDACHVNTPYLREHGFDDP